MSSAACIEAISKDRNIGTFQSAQQSRSEEKERSARSEIRTKQGCGDTCFSFFADSVIVRVKLIVEFPHL